MPLIENNNNQHNDQYNDQYKEKQRELLFILLIMLVVFICYGNSLTGALVSDDHLLVESNEPIKSILNWPKLFVQVYWGEGHKQGLYRPVTNVTYGINYLISGTNTFSYHLFNVIMHFINALFIYWLTFFYTKKRVLALACGLIFAAHPVHTEAVSAIFGRPEILATLFSLWSWWLFVKRDRHRSYLLLSQFLFLLALLSKESAVVTIGLLGLIIFFAAPGNILEKIKYSLLQIKWFFIVTGIYLVFRYIALKSIGLPDVAQFLFGESFTTRLFTMSLGFLKYFQLLIWPQVLSADYDYSLIARSPSLTFGVAAAMATIILTIVIGLYYINRNNFIAFSILSFFICTSVVSNIIFVTGILIAERVLYLPSISICLLLAGGINWLYERGSQKVAIAILMIILSLASVRCYLRNLDWQNEYTYITAILRVSPNHVRALYSLGWYYSNHGESSKAEAPLKRAVELAPGSGYAQAMLAEFYVREKRYDEAVPIVKLAIDLSPHLGLAHTIMGRIYSAKQDYANAVKSFKLAVDNSAVDPYLIQEYGIALYQNKNIDEAITILKQVNELKPDYAEAYVNLSIALREQGRVDEALAALDQALKLEPENAQTQLLYGLALLAKQDLCGAKAALIKTINIDNNLAEAHNNLGVTYAQMGKYREAQQEFSLALKLNPNYQSAINNLTRLQSIAANEETNVMQCP